MLWRNSFNIIVWDVLSVNNCMTQKDKPPRNYPDSNPCDVEAPAGRNCPQNIIMPRVQTNDWLTTDVKFTYANRKEDKWNKTECREYLAIVGIARKIRKYISKIRMENEFKIVDTNMVDKLSAKRLYQCTYASAWTWSVVRYYFGIAQIINIKDQINRI